MPIPPLRLRPHEDRRLRAGHLWIYANEIDTATTPLGGFAAGELCRVEDAHGTPLGVGYVNPHSLLAARLLDPDPRVVPDAAWFGDRLRAALALRERLYEHPFYRLVYGEGDGLPGLVIDRYGDVLVVQINTAGMDRLRPALEAALTAEIAPRGILWRLDTAARTAEGLPSTVEESGEVPERATVVEGGLEFAVDLRGGQKTGWFYDQRDNRDRLGRMARGARVLDLFSYVGGWSLRALEAGAIEATAVDSSAEALTRLADNAARQGREVETLRGEALEALRALRRDGRKFDLVVVDPPALIKRRRDHAAGLSLYQRLNRAAIDVLAPGGILVSCSCSFHLSESELQRVLLRAARGAGRPLALIGSGGQGADHPVHPAIPETRYLKAFYATVGAG
jgi:SAM-dependent methyltransferase (EC 2.1.1.-)